MAGGGDDLIDLVCERIERAPILLDPYPHLLIERLFPDDLYEAALTDLADATRYREVTYPGTGVDTTTEPRVDYGLALDDWSGSESLATMRSVFDSPRITETLLARFTQEPADVTSGWIPAAKRQCIEHGDTATVYDIQRDLPGYEITPHADVESKIVTFLLYLEPDDCNAEWGTHMCVPADGLDHDDVRTAPRLAGHPSWYPWELFRTAKIAPATPNTFFAFAPHERSYHAVRMDVPADHPRRERTVLRGFVRTGRDTSNWIADRSPQQLAPVSSGRVRRLGSRVRGRLQRS